MNNEELKAFNMPQYAGAFTTHEVYLKSEADKVIEDLEESHKKEVEQLLIEIVGLKNRLLCCKQNYPRTRSIIMDEVAEAIEKYHGLVPLVYDIETMGLAEARPQDMYYAVYLKREADKVIAHNKFKRCLAMARWCGSEAYIHEHGSEYDEDLVAWFGKWHKRWLELAEKFKENV